jgi:hypothetical protein
MHLLQQTRITTFWNEKYDSKAKKINKNQHTRKVTSPLFYKCSRKWILRTKEVYLKFLMLMNDRDYSLDNICGK